MVRLTDRVRLIWHRAQVRRAMRHAPASLRRELSREEVALSTRIQERVSELFRDRGVITHEDFGAGPAVSKEFERIKQVEIRSKARAVSKSRPWAELLLKLVRETRPEVVLEMGTAFGVSGAYLAGGLVLNGKGSMVSLEGSAEVAAIARATFATLNLHNVEVVIGPFDETLDSVLKARGNIELVFIDAHHEGSALKRYLLKLEPYLVEEAIIVIDDIHAGHGLNAAWREVAALPSLAGAYDLGRMGIVRLAGQGLSLSDLN